MQKFFTGDLVEYIGTGRSWEKGVNHIIHECKYHGQGVFYYSTNLGAWFNHQEFKLIQKATKKTLNQLDKDLDDEQ